MGLTERSLRNPAGVAVAVAIVLLFGLFSLSKLPVQLFPDIEEPRLSIVTSWRAASPLEIESEIVEPLEEVLQGLPGLDELEVFANPGVAWINLRFSLETDMQQTLVDVISRLNRLPPLPADADPPTLRLGEGGGGANRALSWFFIQLLPGNRAPDRELPALHRRRGERAPHRDSPGGCRRRDHGRRPRGAPDPLRSLRGGRARDRDPRGGGGGGTSRRCLGRLRRRRPAAVHAALRRPLRGPKSSPSWSSTGVTDGRSAWETSPRSKSAAAIAKTFSVQNNNPAMAHPRRPRERGQRPRDPQPGQGRAVAELLRRPPRGERPDHRPERSTRRSSSTAPSGWSRTTWRWACCSRSASSGGSCAACAPP